MSHAQQLLQRLVQTIPPDLSTLSLDSNTERDKQTLEQKFENVLDILKDPSISDDDKPDALRTALASLLQLSNASPRLDEFILSLMHRHKEDNSPSGNPLPPLPISRSGSTRHLSRNSTPAASPWPSPRLAHRVAASNSSNALTIASLMPNNSNSSLSVSAAEFIPGTSTPLGSRPGTPLRSVSPALTAQAAQQAWAANSPLGTPKFVSPSRNYSPIPFNDELTKKSPWLNGTTNSTRSNTPVPPEKEWILSGNHSEVANAEEEWRVLQDQMGQYGPGPSPSAGSTLVLPGAGSGAWDPFSSDNSDVSGSDFADMSVYGNGAFGPEVAGLGGNGGYLLTPFDHLHMVFAESNISSEILEEALALNGYEVDAAIEFIIDLQAKGQLTTVPGELAGLQAPVVVARPQISGSKPLVISRDNYESLMGPSSGRGSPKWGSRPGTPSGERGVGGRVCRFYLSGSCLRSDCKFSHDVGKAVCKFWLRGHCLKGEGRCDFLHTIPPVMRADFENRARLRMAQNFPAEPILDDSGPDLDFPALGEAPRSRRGPGGTQFSQRGYDPHRARFAGAVKFGQRATNPSAAMLNSNNYNTPTVQTPVYQPKPSNRLMLRPPVLLPSLSTGAVLSELYAKYRSTFLGLGTNRNKCLAKAAECWKRGDGAGARKFSREANDWNRQVAIEGRDAARRILDERKRQITEALENSVHRAGTVDDIPDRKARGRPVGGGVCLGVVSPKLLPKGDQLSPDERTEVALDLHGLHADEAISFLGEFLGGLERERFMGLAFVVIGQAKHTGSSDAERGASAGKVRLEQSCVEFLADQGWPWMLRDGILRIDPVR